MRTALEGRGKADAGVTRERILEAALEAFSIHGYSGTSIGAVARELGVTPALIHYYFRTKRELWESAADRGMGDALGQLADVLEELRDVDVLARLKFFVRRYINVAADHEAIFRLIIRESNLPGPAFNWLAQHHLAPLYALMITLIEEGQAAGLLRRDAPAWHIAQILTGACYHFIASRNRLREAFGVDTHEPALRARHAELVIETLLVGLGAGTRPDPMCPAAPRAGWAR